METKKCYVCKEKHEEDSWRWKQTKIKGKKVWYCHYGINCIGCKELHSFKDMGGYRSTPRGEICRKWYSVAPTLKQKLSNLSPEEVVSGGLAGLPNQFKTNSEDRTKEVVAQERKEVLEALK